MTNDCVHQYTWDAEHKMHSVDASPASCSTSGQCLTYDAMGRMVEKVSGSTVMQIVYGPQGRFATMNGQTLLKAFIPLPTGATAVYTSSGLAYYRHVDHLGSARLATTPSRTPYGALSYSPYGETYSQSGSTDLDFAGQERYTVTGLLDATMRKFATAQGRWLSPDPAGLAAANPANPQSWNRYAYVLNSPMGLVDPSGLDPCNLNGSNVDGNVNCLIPPCSADICRTVTAYIFDDWVPFDASIRDPNCPGGFVCVWMPGDLGPPPLDLFSRAGGNFPAGIINMNPLMPHNKLADCIGDLFGEILLDFSPTVGTGLFEPGNRNGTATLWFGFGDLGVPLVGTITNDISHGPADMPHRSNVYTNYDISQQWITGWTNARNPWVNYTLNGLIGSDVVDTQIYELGNSLAFINNSMPAHLSDPSQDPGNGLLNCVNGSQTQGGS